MEKKLIAAFTLMLAAAAHTQSQDSKPSPEPGKNIRQEAVCNAYGRLPDVQPPFAPSKTGRQPVALKTFNVTAAYLRDSEKAGDRTRVNPLLVSGNKAISVNGLNPYGYFADSAEFLILVNGRSLLNGHFVGVLKGGGYGYPFPAKEGTKPTASFDAANRSVTASKEYQLVPAGTATYSHTMKALEDGKIRLSWDLGLSPEAFSALRGERGLSFTPEFYLDAS